MHHAEHTPTPHRHHTPPPPIETPQPTESPVATAPPLTPPPVVQPTPTLKPHHTHTPTPHKVIVDLHEVVRPDPDPAVSPDPTPSPRPTPTHTHHPHVTPPPQDTPDPTQSTAEIQHELEQHLQHAGVQSATNTGDSGIKGGQASDFGGFYDSIKNQVYDQWHAPGSIDPNLQAIVQIHVEKDGRVPREQVTLVRSSGNQAYDDSALDAARNLGQLNMALPEGCPPDIKITFDPIK